MKQTRYIARMGILLALACAVSFLETTLPLPLPLGVKPGLASIVVMFALLRLDAKSAWALTILKSVFVLLTRGVTAGLLSLSGGVLSLCAMLLLLRVLHSSLLLMSTAGGIAHNLGQLCASVYLLQNAAAFYTLPILLLAGCIAGIATGICLRLFLQALPHMHADFIP